MVHEFLGSTTDTEDNFEEYQVSFNTDQGWFGVSSQTYADDIPFEKGQYITSDMVEDLASNSLEKVSSGSFNLQRPVPEGCGDFVSYRIYQQDGTVLGNTTELEFAHTGLTNVQNIVTMSVLFITLMVQKQYLMLVLQFVEHRKNGLLRLPLT